jgi:hypothetical protein
VPATPPHGARLRHRWQSDGRIGRDTLRAVSDYQKKVGISPADGYAGLKVLARLRQSS